MASAVAARLASDIVRDHPLGEGLNPRISSETFTKEIVEDAQSQNLTSTSSYTLASQSQLSGDVDRWIRGNTSMESTGVQNSRVHLVQRSTLAMGPALGTSGIWYFLAMVLPLFSIDTNCQHWRCNPGVLCYALSAVLTTAELVAAHVGYIFGRVRDHVGRLAQDQLARDLLATAMDVVLVFYAVGFLIISMYQASVIVSPLTQCHALSAVLTTAELVAAHVGYICGQLREHVGRLARDQLARDLLATAMDVVLVFYAVGFLIISMYQASIIGGL